ncbi:MAG: gephyrin-like molybdotransferase Glp [Alphaproteobacteria bacterium]
MMLTVEEALERILRPLRPVPAETVSIAAARGRVLAEDVASRRTQPPSDVSAMDGYAVRAGDVARLPASLTVIGEAPAGRAFSGDMGAGEAVRIFTGGPVPAGADTIVLQEDVEPAEGSPRILVREAARPGRHIRQRGQDIAKGAPLLKAGTRLGPRQLGLLAAADVPWLTVHRRPRIALLATGGELKRPGEPMTPEQIVASIGYALSAYVEAWGGAPADIGIAEDTPEALREGVARARGADLLVTTGGASVGDYDLLKDHLPAEGFALDFWRVAMRPGKPLLFGKLGELPLLGLPGNPVSALVCAQLFLRPAVARLSGLSDPDVPLRRAALGVDLPENGPRQNYMRAEIRTGSGGVLTATPLPVQDSAMLSGFAKAGGLIVRPPLAPAASAGEPAEVLLFADLEPL